MRRIGLQWPGNLLVSESVGTEAVSDVQTYFISFSPEAKCSVSYKFHTVQQENIRGGIEILNQGARRIPSKPNAAIRSFD